MESTPGSDDGAEAQIRLLTAALDLTVDLPAPQHRHTYSGPKRGLDAAFLRHAAQQLGVGVRKLSDLTTLVEVGNRTLMLHKNMPMDLMAVDRAVTNNKQLTKDILNQGGVPTAAGFLVDSPDAAARAFESIEGAVVTKPITGSGGQGVSVDLRTPEDVVAAASELLGERRRIVVEEMVRGVDVRVMTIAGKTAGVCIRIPANVVGDGLSTITELVEAKNEERARNDYLRHSPLVLGAASESTLRLQGLAPDSVLPAGRRAFLHLVSNISLGGDNYEAAHLVHPEILQIAERAAACFPRAVHVGVDILAERIDAPAAGNRIIVCEVNLNNELGMHVLPMFGEPNPVHKPLMRALLAGRKLRPLPAPLDAPPGLPASAMPPALEAVQGKAPAAAEHTHNEFIRTVLGGQGRVIISGNVVMIQTDSGMRVLHRTGRTIAPHVLSRDPEALAALAKYLGVPYCAEFADAAASADVLLLNGSAKALRLTVGRDNAVRLPERGESGASPERGDSTSMTVLLDVRRLGPEACGDLAALGLSYPAAAARTLGRALGPALALVVEFALVPGESDPTALHWVLTGVRPDPDPLEFIPGDYRLTELTRGLLACPLYVVPRGS